jgi:hypothetical protein
MMRHRLDLRMQHRVIDEALDALRARRGGNSARISNLVAADIWADVIDRLRAGSGLGERARILEAAEADFGSAERKQRTGMIGITDEGTHLRAFRRQCLHDSVAALTGGPGNQNHRAITAGFIAIWPSARTSGRD